MNTLLEHVSQLWRRWTTPRVDTPTDDRPIDRQSLFDELAELERGHVADMAQRQRQIDDIHAEIVQVEGRAAVLRSQLARLDHANLERSWATSQRVDRLRMAIAETAPAALNDFLAKITNELEELRHREAEIRPDGSDRDYVRMKKTPRFQSNAPSIKRRVTALQAAYAEAEALLTAPLSAAEIVTEIRRLERTLPSVELEEVRNFAALIMG
ncbi:hypothetical protein YTPLAS18_17180 [Nitrospira sp.]|nr:hypothetical protein YTPLAS18_17180 [Nitrospira sp.]